MPARRSLAIVRTRLLFYYPPVVRSPPLAPYPSTATVIRLRSKTIADAIKLHPTIVCQNIRRRSSLATSSVKSSSLRFAVLCSVLAARRTQLARTPASLVRLWKVTFADRDHVGHTNLQRICNEMTTAIRSVKNFLEREQPRPR